MAVTNEDEIQEQGHALGVTMATVAMHPHVICAKIWLPQGYFLIKSEKLHRGLIWEFSNYIPVAQIGVLTR